jgi:WD40 repeat protein
VKKSYIIILLLLCSELGFMSLFSGVNFVHRDSRILLLDNTSQFKISNKDSVSSWKKQSILKGENPNYNFLTDNQVWQTSGDQLAPEETFELMDNFNISDGQLVKLSANAVIDGQGHDLILGKYSQLLIDGGVTVTFKNMTIKNTLNTISCPPIRCMDWYSKACFDNVTFAFNDDWAFRNGQFFIHNDVNLTGTSKFSYRSVRPSYITSHANMIFDSQTTFEYYPSTTNNNLIQMADKTSSIIFDGSTLQTTHTGICLTKGSLYFDNKVTLSSADNTLTWSVGKGTIINTSGYLAVSSIAFSPDGKYLVLGNESANPSKLYRFDGNSCLYITDVEAVNIYATRSVEWSPDGKYLVLGNDGQSNRLYRFNGDSFTFLCKVDDTPYATYKVEWSPDGKYLAIANYSQASKIYRFNGTSFTFVDDINVPTHAGLNVYTLAWRPDGKYLVLGYTNGSAARSELYSFDGNSCNYITDVDSTVFYTTSVAWSPDGNYLVLGNHDNGQQCMLYRFNGNHFTPLGMVDNNSYFTYGVAWSPDGQYLVLVSNGPSKIYRFNGNSFTPLFTAPYNVDYAYTRAVSWSPDGKYFALGSNSNPWYSKWFNMYTKYDTSPQGFSNGIIFGSSALGASYDTDMYVLGGASVILNGKVWYDDVS